MINQEISFPHYKGNPKIRPAGIKIDFTADQVSEIIKCSQNCIYFCETYLKINTLDHGLQPLKLRQYQIDSIIKMVDSRFVLNRASRQSGKTTVTAAVLIWYTLFNENYETAILAHKQTQAVEILDRIKIYYQNLPYWMQYGVVEWNKLSIEIENGSKIFAAASSTNAVAGKTLNCLDGAGLVTIRNKHTGLIETIKLVDFQKRIGDYEVLTEEGFKSFDGISISKKFTSKLTLDDNIEIIGTPEHKLKTTQGWFEIQNITIKHIIIGKTKNYKVINNCNYQEQLVYDLINVKDTNSYYYNNIVVHNCCYMDEFDLLHPNIQEDLYNTTFPTISSGSKSKFYISSTPRGFKFFFKLWNDSEKGKNDFVRHTINWWDVPGRDDAWRLKEIERMGGSDLRFRQEYQCEFLGSSNSLINGDTLSNLVYETPIQTNPNGTMQFFEHVIAGRKYLISVDVSEGVEGDYSAFTVLDVTTAPYKVVCTYADNTINPLLYPTILHDIGKYYNDAYIAVESNTVGQQVVNILYYDLEYENILSTTTAKASKKENVTDSKRKLGIHQSRRTKPIGCSNLKTLIENDQLLISDFRIFYELSRFVRKGGTFRAEDGDHDDLVMTLVTFAYITTLDFFKSYTNTDPRTNIIKNKDVDDFPVTIVHNIPESELSEYFGNISEFDRWMIS